MNDKPLVPPPKRCPGSKLVPHRRCRRLIRCRKTPPIGHAGPATQQPSKGPTAPIVRLGFDHPCNRSQPTRSPVTSSQAKSP
jgi:hypothetical protein